jgi:DnaD/phage-associated family protein
MKNFKGFSNSETFTPIPDSFFRRLLNAIQEADEFKVTLYALWRIEHMESALKGLCEADFDPEELGLDADGIRAGLEKAVGRGSLLRAQYEAQEFFFLNSPQGQAAARAFAQGKWKDSAMVRSAPPIERPNIFRLYEENMGPLLPLIADALKDAEETYTPEWVAEAIELAVKNNKRSWKYCEAILKRWKEEGRAQKQDRRNAEEDGSRYIKGEFADYIEH